MISKRRKWLSCLLALSISIISCQNQTNSEDATESSNSTQIEVQQKDDCNCSNGDADAFAMKIVDDFTRTQDELPSEEARVISIYKPVEKRNNCTWGVTFKISYPFGNTDGLHPDEFIEKHLVCDGKEIYAQ